ncbi:TPA: IS66 family transposase [Legionella pneumophila]|nr:IS66 family transposase [Legionella pneumophila]
MKKTDSLPQSISELQALVLALQEENVTLKQNYERVLEQFRLAQQQRFSRSSESNVLQMELQFDEAEAIPAAELPEEENTVTITYTRNKPKRQTLPDDLPREVIEHDIPEQDKQCVCGCLKQRIGEEVTEQLEIIPAQLKVIAHVRPKYACNRCDEGVSIAPMPRLFLPKSMAAPSLVAHTIVSKYQNHLPLYRQEKIWEGMGIHIPRNTACGWVIHAAEVCMPMREALISALLTSHYLQADETPLQVMNEPGRNNTSNSYMWVYQSAKPDKKVILFDYRETRQALWPKEILSGYQGYLQTDGYSGYDWVNQHPDIIHLGCMAHARRPFAELVKLAKTTGKSHQAVAFFQKLYAIEKQAKVEKLSPEQRHQLRLSKALPILNEMEQWLEQSIRHAVPQSKLGNALAYMQQRWKELNHYLLDGILEIDNNAIENQIRPFALGRKNWLFAATPNGAHASALFYSLIATANANGCNPFDYLRALFQNIRACRNQHDYNKLLPFNLMKIPT